MLIYSSQQIRRRDMRDIVSLFLIGPRRFWENKVKDGVGASKLSPRLGFKQVPAGFSFRMDCYDHSCSVQYVC